MSMGDTMILCKGRRSRRARLTFGDAPFQLAPESLPGGRVAYWGLVAMMAASAFVSFGAVLG